MALEAPRGNLAVAQPVARHGVHQTLTDALKWQAVEGMAGVISGKLRGRGSATPPRNAHCIPTISLASAGLGR